MNDRPMTPDEMEQFEKEIVQHDDTRDDLTIPASESATIGSDERARAEPPTAIVPPPLD